MFIAKPVCGVSMLQLVAVAVIPFIAFRRLQEGLGTRVFVPKETQGCTHIFRVNNCAYFSLANV